MAGDWLKVDKDTPDKPEIFTIATRLSITPDEAFGKCFRIWRWFDSHTTEGNAPSVTSALLDALVNRSGFCEAMKFVGWLEISEAGVSASNFDKHMGESAKKRGLTAKRVADHKRKGNAKGNAPCVTKALTEEEEELDPKSLEAEPGEEIKYQDLKDIDWDRVAERASWIATQIPTTESHVVTWCRVGVLMQTTFGESDVTEAIKQTRKKARKEPAGYFLSVLRNKAKEDGCDLTTMLKVILVPRDVLNEVQAGVKAQ